MKPMTITEKILAAHGEKEYVEPNDIIEAKVDLVLANDITAPLIVDLFEKYKINNVFDRNKVVLTPDHFTPNKDIKTAQEVKKIRDFAKKHRIINFIEVGRCGIEHAYLPEQGFVAPGELIIGADSHTCTYGALAAFATGVGSTDAAAAIALGKIWLKVPDTMKLIYEGKLREYVYGKDLILYTIGQIGVDGALYKAMEFCGDAIKSLSMDSRFSICNMAIEAGAKSGIIEFDEKTSKYVNERVKRSYKIYFSDKEAQYSEEIYYDVSNIEPQVALPHLPSNTKAVSEISKIEIDQVVIGSCTNGRLEDLEIAARIMKGKKIAENVRCVIIPATQKIWLESLEKGYLKIFVEAGCSVSTPTCGPCLGGHMGILAEGERAIATTNRNFIGRMGHTKSEIFLSNAAIAAASAIKGYICHPKEVL